VNVKQTPASRIVRTIRPQLVDVRPLTSEPRRENGSGTNTSLAVSDVAATVIVPVYNEEKAIESVIANIKTALTQLDIKYEIIVVDDGSTDQSAQIISNIDGITYIQHPTNTGYGSALKTGIRYAAGEFVVITDGDGTYPNQAIPGLIRASAEYDMVVGARSINDHNIPLIRKPAKWLLGKLANYLSETVIPDLNSGLRVFRRDVALRFYKIFPSGFSFTTTITLAMHCNGYRVKYVPIEYNKRAGKSKIRPIHDTINFIQLILRTVMYFNPLKIFLPIATFVFIAFLMSSIVDIVILDNLTDKTVIFFLAFVQILVLGLLADLIDKRNS
jgi:glycosyltransferase involved in cell wall biosynthesis